MSSSDIRVVQLEPLRLATLVGTGLTPELNGWQMLLRWAQEHGCLDAKPAPRFFGYDVWRAKDAHDYRVLMTVSENCCRDSQIDVITLPGGIYAVHRVHGTRSIPGAWQQLDDWLNDSSYQLGQHQWLEEHIRFIDLPEQDFLLDLYLPLTPVAQPASG